MQAESGCISDRDNAGLNTNGTNDVGLMQINSIHVVSGLISEGGRKDPATNIKAAHSIYLGSGWSAWSAYNSGKYAEFL